MAMIARLDRLRKHPAVFRSLRPLLLAMVALVLLAAACGGDDSSDEAAADTTAPTGSVDQTGPFAGNMAFTATADDPESGVSSIQIFAQINMRCYRIGDLTDPGVPVSFDNQSTPLATGSGGQMSLMNGPKTSPSWLKQN